MTPAELSAIVERHAAAEGNSYRSYSHADRGALLDLCRRLAKVIEEQASALGREVCPLCGDPECPSPLLEALTQESL